MTTPTRFEEANADKRQIAFADVSWRVPVIAQSRTMSCWAAATAMLLTWKQQIPVSEEQAARAAGNSYLIAFHSNQGVLGTEIADLARLLHLATEPPQSLSAEGYHSLLSAHGPLWVGTAIFSTTAVYRHVRIVTGIRSSPGTAEPELDLIDPDGGRIYRETISRFGQEFEEIARQDLGAGHELRPQVIHHF